MTANAMAVTDAASLFETHARLIDQDRLEEWLELFTEDCVYEVLTRENVTQSLPLPLILCDSKNMLSDRILSLRKANIYNVHQDRHILGLVCTTSFNASAIEATASYAVYQTNQDGETRLFSVGEYLCKIVRRGHRLLFERLTVIADTAGILTLLATPI
jgi:anthranilate 1,2-dioxygenase small subunit